MQGPSTTVNSIYKLDDNGNPIKNATNDGVAGQSGLQRVLTNNQQRVHSVTSQVR